MKYSLLVLLLLSFWSNANSEEFHYNDCVELTGGFFYQENEQLVGWVVDEREIDGNKEYRIGNILFGIWVKSNHLKKVSREVCVEAEGKELK